MCPTQVGVEGLGGHLVTLALTIEYLQAWGVDVFRIGGLDTVWKQSEHV